MQLRRRPFLLLTTALLLSAALPTTRVRADDPKLTLFQVCQGGKWGYIDATGKVVIPFQFDDAMSFSEGLARVKVGGQYGYIDEQGKFVIPPQYQLSWYFRGGLASVEDAPGRFVDRSGKVAFQTPNTHRFLDFREGLAQGRPNTPADSMLQPIPTYGWIDKTGAWAIKPRFAFAWDFNEGLSAVTLGDGKWGFIGTNGEWTIQPSFDSATYFSEGLAAVQSNGRYFYINKKGDRAFSGDYDDTTLFHEGLAAVEVGDKWGFINTKGKRVIKPQFEQVDSFFNGRAAFSENGKWGYIDPKGNVVIPATYSYAGFFLGDLAAVSVGPDTPDGSGRSYISRDGKAVWSPQSMG